MSIIIHLGVRILSKTFFALYIRQYSTDYFLTNRQEYAYTKKSLTGDSTVMYYTKCHSTTNLISSFLLKRSQCVYFNGEYSFLGSIFKGVPQGSILGPLLFCLYINDMPFQLSNPKTKCYLFADDGSISASAKTTEELESMLQKDIDKVASWSSANKMIIHPEKTKCMIIASRQKHQLDPLELNIVINKSTIQQVDNHKLLGVIIDKDLRWENHINSICKKVSRNLYLLFKLKPYIDVQNMKNFYYAHCLSHFNYCSSVWSKASDIHIKKATRLHRRAANLLSDSDSLSTDEKLSELGLLPLHKQFMFNTLIMMFNAHSNQGPSYLKDLLMDSRRGNRYHIPLTRIDLYKNSFSFQGPSLWNSLPLQIRQCQSITQFKEKIRHILK